MTPSNFDWFLHTMLFYHTKYVIQRQKSKKDIKTRQAEENEDEIIIENGEDRGDADNIGDNYHDGED